MRTNDSKAIRLLALRAASILSFAAVAAFGQQQINLTAGPATANLPDGSAVPMWGYSCGALVTGSTASCAKLNPVATGWSPVVVTVPTGQTLQVSLTNNLPGNVPTSLVIVGQLGGGLGTTAKTVPSPDHSNAQQVTWPIASPGAANTPPPQPDRVRSFSTEVLAGVTTSLTWTTPRPGTYLIESGTHPSIQGPMGLYGILVVTTPPSGATTGTAYPAAGTTAAVTYNTEVPLLLSEIDPVQNNAVNIAVNTAGFSETMVWSGLPGGCGNPSSTTYHQCYPPAVNYTPLYYLFNGVAFDKTHASASVFAGSPGTTATPVTGSVLVRLVNAGLRMHVPSIVGATTKTPAVGGFSLMAEDGNPLPGIPRVQSEVFLPAGKTYDVTINVPASGGAALPVFDRQLSLSGNAIARDAGMLAYIGINGAGLPVTAGTGVFSAAAARADTYNAMVAGQPLKVSDPSKGVIANDTNVYGVTLLAAASSGTVTLNANGTFMYVPNSGSTATSDLFTYCANGSVTAGVCSSGLTATVTLGPSNIVGAGVTCTGTSFSSNVATYLSVQTPGVLAGCKDGANLPVTVVPSSITAVTGGMTVIADANGGFTASGASQGAQSFTFVAQNSHGAKSTPTTVTLNFAAGSGLAVSVKDGTTKSAITDYRWIIEEDRTFYVNPNCTTNPPAAGCPTAGSIVPTFGTNFHTSYMPVIATGCTGTLSCESGQSVQGVPAVCDVGNGVCRTTGTQQTAVDPSQVHLDPAKRYYISVLPGDAANPFIAVNLKPCLPSTASGYDPGSCGHGMGGAPIAAGQTAVTVLAQPTPFPPSKLSVFVFEDDFPLNGEQDGGGGIDVLSPNEPGLGGFNITLFDDAGGTGDATGQMTYDMFNQPLVNSLAGTPDPSNHNIDACPISKISRIGASDPNQTGITGTIVTCPKYEADGTTLSPLAGQAVIANMMPGRYGVVATPAADRIARGEEWLQTNTLDGQKAHDSFLRIGEPSFFQEYGPSGFHVSIGFANPKIINARKASVCNGTNPNITGTNCANTVTGVVTTERMSRTPDERLYSSGDNSSFAFTQCYVSFGDPDGIDFAFTKCDSNGKFTLTGLPDGDWRITVFDQWNDMLVDGLSTPVRLAGGKTLDLGQLAMNQWQANIYTTTFFDANKNGVRDTTESGLTLVPTNIRFRDGSYSNFNNTDLLGNAGFNEVFPLFSWYVIETDSTRYKNTGVHVVYDAGGPADGTPGGANSGIAQFMANTTEAVPVPNSLRVPGSFYCSTADCADAPAPLASGGSGGSTGRVDPPWVTSEGWQGFSGQNSFLEFGKTPYVKGETGGIRGEVIYASTRPFDDPALLIHTSWTPDVPGVTINLYQEGTATDGSQILTLVDTTKTSSFDDWAQGFRTDGNPNMNCPGQATTDLFFFTLNNQPMYLDVYNNGGTPAHTIPNNSQFKCYDGMHNWNQLQPAPYDGMYQFPSVTGLNPSTGKPAGTNCHMQTTAEPWGCTTNPDATDPYRAGTPMLPKGKYVVEVVVPPGYELVKEEDKNILIGDNYIAPVTQQFPGLGSAIYILPDQAEVANAYNANNPQNPTVAFGRTTLPSHEGDTGSVETFWPCVGAARIVPDYISLFPQSQEVAPFAGATRNLCDRKEVTLDDQTSALAKFWIFTSTHTAAHFTGVITDDYTSEFDPFSPQFGEKFSPANLPVAIKDWTGTEVSRVYADQWGTYNGLTYSTWEVNPPNPTGYAPTMMVTCMNDPGTGATPDPLFNPSYSQFCYEIPFMPGQTQYMDTPVVPTSAFAGAGYNNPDCAYPNATPAIASVTSADIAGPWVSASGHSLTITSLGDQMVNNNAYSGPSATTAPYNQKKILRHYGFGATAGTVTIGGANATITSWSDTTITVNVPAISGLSSSCSVIQQAQYGGSTAQCGELVINAANGQKSVDTVTVTIGGKKPTVLTAGQTIQSAIDSAKPGDMIIVPPGVYQELLLMWKPVRLQGVGAASSIINANTHPAGKLDVWRRQVTCLFGLALNGTPISSTNKYDPTSTFTCTPAMQFAVDRLPLEATVGWDATLNGNLAELLQEPTLMGALEGAAITVLAKGVDFHSQDPFAADTFPTGTTLLQNAGPGTSTHCGDAVNPYPSNFMCNPSSIDGLGITNSSQGGGGIFVHAWAHYLQIANNRIYNNAGTLSGGINVGQGEFPPAYIAGSATNAAPGSCQPTGVANTVLPYCHNTNVNVHNNYIASNSSTGDELFSATPAGAGGVSFCTGADYYKFNYNWVCGNLSSGDGGGLGHIGLSYNGAIEHNWILFNQSTNPTIPANGGGIIVMGAPDVDPPCGATTDADCVPPLGSVGPSDGIGPNLVINANLIMGNAAESGSGGGIAFQNVNGSDVVSFPKTPSNWWSVKVTNNIVANNVAGWDGAGISLQDALATNIVNNTIISNDTTASSGVLFNTLGAPLASQQGPTCTSNCGTTSLPQPAGLVSVQNSAVLVANLPSVVICPAGHFAPSTPPSNGSCTHISYPILDNDVIWDNRSFYIGVGSLGTGNLNQQNVVALYNAFTSTPAASQPQADATTPNGAGVIVTGGTGACTPPGSATAVSYWDIGVRGDTGPSNHVSAALTLAPSYSVLTDVADYSAATLHNSGANPTVLSQYCNGSRVPPELGSMGYQVPPGISDATVPNPIFNLTPAATVDEGNNWINISWGPLATTNPVTGATLGNYGIAAGSPAIDYIPSSAGGPLGAYTLAPPTDFYGNPRKVNNAAVDAGAVEFQGAAGGAATLSVTGGPLNFGNVATGSTSPAQTLTLHNTGTAGATGIGLTFSSALYSRPAGAAGGTCPTTLAAGGTCTINVVFSPTAAGAVPATLTINANVAVTGSPVSLTGTGFVRGALSFTSATNGTLTTGLLGVRTLTFTIPTPRAPVTSVVTITNTGAAGTLLPITAETLPVNIGGLYSITGTTCSFTTPLASAGTCTVSVRYATPTTLPGAADTGLMAIANGGTGTVLGNSGLVLSAR